MMHNHVPGSKEGREWYLFELSLSTISGILHSKLHYFWSLLLQMACYLSLPWKEYKCLQLDHTHQAFLLLLFPVIQDLHKNEAQNVQLSFMPQRPESIAIP